MAANFVALNAMHAAHGQGPQGRTCGECAFCIDQRRHHKSLGSVTHYVCRQAPTRTTAHGEVRRPHWIKAWAACGQFQQKAGEHVVPDSLQRVRDHRG